MRIVHLCLANFYKENFGYQENILPRMHKRLGCDVVIFACAQTLDNASFKYIKNDYINRDGIPVKIIKRRTSKFGLLDRIHCALRDYKNVFKLLSSYSPDIIFVHGGQSVALHDVVKYVKNHAKCKFYIDQHVDYFNAPINGIASKINNKIYGFQMRKAEKYCNKFWGTTPWRCHYLINVYKLNKNNVSLLEMGGDDDRINFIEKDSIRSRIRAKLGIDDSTFVAISGGKIDKYKNTDLLLKAFEHLDSKNICLILFGTFNNETRWLYDKYKNLQNVKFIGWIDSNDVYDYYLASDLGIFPGTHSVLWEQACSTGLPCIFKYWEGMQHVNLDGNCLFLSKDSSEQLYDLIIQLLDNSEKYNKMKQIACDKCIKHFSYKEIAKRAIGLKN